MAGSLIPSLFGGGSVGRPNDPFMMLQQQVNRLFEDVFRGGPGGGELAATPRLNISETDRDFRIEAELPGVAEDDVEVTLNDDLLTIRGEKKAEHSERQENYHVMERSYGAFVRTIRLPFAVNPEDISAVCRNGVLEISVPKNAAQEKAHRIEIQKGAEHVAPQSPQQGAPTTH